MRGTVRRCASGAAAALVWLCGVVVQQAQAAPPPADAFTRRPAIRNVVPSPSGKRVALIVVTSRGREAVAVLDLPPTGPPRSVGEFADADIGTLRWLNDDRLVFESNQRLAFGRESRVGAVAVDHDGGNSRVLIDGPQPPVLAAADPIRRRVLSNEWSVQRAVDDGSADLWVQRNAIDAAGDVTSTEGGRLNTLTGAFQPMATRLPAGARAWVFDSRGSLRVVRTTNQGRDRLHVRDAEAGTWAIASDQPLDGDAGMSPRFLEDDHALVVQTRAGEDTQGVYLYDLGSRRLAAEPLVRVGRYDVGSVELDEKERQVVAAHLLTDRPTSVWFTPRMVALQKAIDGALPAGRSNRILCGHCQTSAFYIVLSMSDQEPGDYHVYDFAKRTLTLLGSARPWIDGVAQGARTFHWIKARDGMPLPVVVTHPPGRPRNEPLPAVVLLQREFGSRGSLGWDAEAQFLATRGYRVIEPDTRGTFGYGSRHWKAGLRQWGRAMQDDLADAVAWAAGEQLVDAGRVCIVGSGYYGGFAALTGMARDPGVYRCAASYGGATDLPLLFSSRQSLITRDALSYSMPILIGDPVRDAALLRDVSPIEQVARIKGPVLLAQGALDRLVPREQANAFEAAAKRAGVEIERVDYNDEGGGWTLPDNHADFLNRVDRFVARSLKPRGAP